MTLADIYTSRAWRLVRFCTVGGACFLLSWSLLWLGTDIAFALVALFGHSGNRIFTFSATQQAYFPQLQRYVLTTIASLGLSLLLMWLLVEFGRFHYLLANGFVAAIVALLNFWANRIWVFGERASGC
jgi:putative flippase GtrA